MTISVTDTALDMEKKAIERYARRGHRLRFWIAWIYCGIFLVSSAVFYMFWCTDTFNDYVLSQMELRNGSRTFEWWQQPPTRMRVNIYIFNYTNVDEFEAGVASKLRVQQLGPYTYRQTLTRMNVVLHDNGTVTFQNKYSFEWIGGRRGNDTIVVPNVPLMFATAYIRDLNFAMQLIINTVLSSLREQPFIHLTSDSFLWGYDTQLFEMAKPLMMLERDIPFEKFGLMAVVRDRKLRLIARGFVNFSPASNGICFTAISPKCIFIFEKVNTTEDYFIGGEIISSRETGEIVPTLRSRLTRKHVFSS